MSSLANSPILLDSGGAQIGSVQVAVNYLANFLILICIRHSAFRNSESGLGTQVHSEFLWELRFYIVLKEPYLGSSKESKSRDEFACELISTLGFRWSPDWFCSSCS